MKKLDFFEDYYYIGSFTGVIYPKKANSGYENIDLIYWKLRRDILSFGNIMFIIRTKILGK